MLICGKVSQENFSELTAAPAIPNNLFNGLILLENPYFHIQNLWYNTPQTHTKAVVEISEHEIAKVFIYVPCPLAYFPLCRGHYLDDDRL